MQRRDFLRSSALFSLIAVTPALAKKDIADHQPTQVLEGDEFDLHIKKTWVHFGDKPVIATTVNDMLPAPTLKWKKGDIVTIHVTNHLDEPTSLHWHGIILPYTMDGVPGVSYPGIMPGERFTYRFKVEQNGTYWYHSHSGFQEQTGLHGAIVIDDDIDADRDYVVGFHDWSDEDPDSIYRKLKLQSGYYNFQKRTVFDFAKEVQQFGFAKALQRRAMWNKMRMDDRDLADVTAYTYTYCINEHTNKNPAYFFFKPGEKVRLRLINQSAMTYFDVRIPGLKMKVVAADGVPVEPVEVDDLRIAVAESYDVLVCPTQEAYTIFAQSIDRYGYVYGILSTSPQKRAPIPKFYPYEPLSMVDMGMAMDGMKMNRMKKKMAHETKIPKTPLPMKKGIAWTMEAKGAMYRLDDPGVGLRSVQRKVLTYADLHTPNLENRFPDREIELHLTGNMERYIWAINGIPYYESKPLQFRYGERLRITFINDTMMNHPMHLHGMWSDIEIADGKILRKHTVNVQPGSKLSMRVNVDATGRWVFHCHLLYHMGGMFREVKVLS
ncbi:MULTISPECIES: copper resistance system multicopper oxidase [unclassified Nitratiruptor]|uniref:copper resistance system multicopper oxidase n=1 Tax=unclassified Nitratiruptor TaxID=2624044 RepID=UPI001915C26C|nr:MULTISPECIES: copper resistance system multicopper oxidase [unclassified Nitratiruptor]BCD59808.1 hypothetical protein NitYY0810_C0565 [Nitratiruptor sp. YY08-10]BCD63732.1 hypothetical protein NitYY0814_C0565 [Nitratiruptor sp. YY08-14]